MGSEKFHTSNIFDNWFSLRWSSIVLEDMSYEDIPTTAEFVNEICC